MVRINLIIFGLFLTFNLFGQYPRIILKQLEKADSSGQFIIADSDSNAVWSDALYITTDSLLTLYGDTIEGGINYEKIQDTIAAMLEAGLGIQMTYNDEDGEFLIESLSIEDSIYNGSGSLISKGTPLYAVGTQGNYWNVAPADASDITKLPAVVIAGEDIGIGETGVGLLKGHIKQVNTTGLADGDEVYVGVGGGYTNVKPKGESNYVQRLGTVIKGNSASGSGIINLGEVQSVSNLNAGNIFIGDTDSTITTTVYIVDSSRVNATGDSLIYYQNGIQVGADAIGGALSGLVENQVIFGAADGSLEQDSNLIWDGLRLNIGQYLNNVFIGYNSGNSNVSGTDNTALGTQALGSIASGLYNTAIGDGALSADSSGNQNVAIGRSSLILNKTGFRNTGIGNQSLNSNVNGFQNIGIGYIAGGENVSGFDNIFIGSHSGRESTGDRNIFIEIGLTSASNTLTGDNNIVIGYSLQPSMYGDADNNILIGNDIALMDSVGDNQLNIANAIFGVGLTGSGTTIDSSASIGINNNNPTATLDVTGWVNVSDSLVVNDIRVTGSGGGTINGVTTDATLTGDGTSGTPLKVDTSIIATQGDLSDYVTVAGTQTITGAKTFTSALTQSGGDVNFDSGTLFVDESANRVGIGTSSPSTTLDINGSIKANRTNTFPAEFTTTSSQTDILRGAIVGNAISTGDMADGFGPAVTFQIQDNTSNLEPIAYFGGFRDGSDVKGGLAFYTATAQYNYQERMTIKSDGNVGIGTTSPSAKLDVVGDVEIDGKLDLNEDNNVYIGTDVGRVDDGGNNQNVGVGYQALYSNTSGNSNTAIGFQALYDNTSGEGNFALGFRALFNNLTGYENTSVGKQSMQNNETGALNVAIGNVSLYNNTSGFSNTAIGYYSMVSNETGNRNTALGLQSLYVNTSGNDNTAIGYQSLRASITGNNNTAIGYDAGRYTNTGANNTDGDNSVFIGYDSRPLADSQSNQIVIGYDAIGLGTNSVVLGNGSITKTRLQGDVGIGTDSPSAKLDVVGNTELNGALTQSGGDVNFDSNTFFVDESANKVGIGTITPNADLEVVGDMIVDDSTLYVDAFYNAVGIVTKSPSYQLDVVGDINASGEVRNSGIALTSDSRYKKNITSIYNGLDKIKQLNPVTYYWNDLMLEKLFNSKSKTKELIKYGLIAQEVESIMPEFVSEGEDGFKAIDYQAIITLLIASEKEQQAIIESIQTELDAKSSIIKTQATEIEQLKSLITELSNRLTILENK